MNQTNIRFSTNILKRLGEELNPDLTQGLIELVKNAYDADARQCTIEFYNISTRPLENQSSLFPSKITIKDDGVGMTNENIINNWLLLGESKKTVEQKTELGRIPVGDKGLGRLAALRLGTKATLKTISQNNPLVQYCLVIDWTAYDNAHSVEEVLLEITEENFVESQVAGTEIIIENITRHVTSQEIQKFARALVLLANPFAEDELGFKPILKIPEFREIEQLVEQRYFREAEFHLVATARQGDISVEIQDWKGNVLYTATRQEIHSKSLTYAIPDTIFELWVFDFESGTFSTRSAVKEGVKKWLKEFGGVHLYYNQLRVLPYGDKQEKWLDSSLKRLTGSKKSPNLIGRLLVTDTTRMLQQTTDRHGFIENTAFVEFKQFAADVFEWMAKRWEQEQNKKAQIEKERLEQEAGESKRSLNEAINAISDDTQRKRLEKAYQERERSYQAREDKLRKALQLYRTLSTTGITATVFAHESQSNPLKNIALAITTIENRCNKLLEKQVYVEKLEKAVQYIKQSTSSLKVLSGVALSLVDHEKRRNTKLEIHTVINETIQLFSSFIQGRSTQVNTQFTENCVYFLGSRAALESIIVNLLNNSLVAFEKKLLEQRMIVIRTEIISYPKAESGKGIEIQVLDNGTGIEGIHVDNIWLAGETTTQNGTGLGLTIVRDTVRDMGGYVQAVAKTEELGGAKLMVILPILEVHYES